MSQSSPSLLNSLRRFQFQKKQTITHNNKNANINPHSLSPEPNEDDCDFAKETDRQTVIENSKPDQVNFKSNNSTDSDETVRGYLSENDTKQSLSQDNIASLSQNILIASNEVKMDTTHNKVEAKSIHSISDSDEEQQKQKTEEEDDDDVVFVSNPRSRTPKPIVVSDDDDDDGGEYPSNGATSEVESPIVNNGTTKESKVEPEILIIDDDSNSVEMIQSENQQKKCKPEIKEELNNSKENNKRKKQLSESPQPKAKRKRKKKINSDSEEESVGGPKVFDSDADSDEEISNVLTEPKRKVLQFLNEAMDSELRLIPSSTAKKIETIKSERPYEDWVDLVTKFQTARFLGPGLLNGAQQVIEAREVVSQLMRRCERIATRTESAIAAGAHSITHQPSILNPDLKLMSYQMVGLNWLNVMNSQNLNGILADEMGLGKTIQVVAFLAHLKETGQTTPNSPHLIVVPASTLENWCIEFEKWCPALKVEQYYGSPEDRKWLRHTWVKDGFADIDVVLTTYSMVGSCYEERKMFRVVNLHYVIFDEAHMLKNMNTQRYENLLTINALHKTLLTGTPLQNNLLELMSLLVFVMPDIFLSKIDNLKFLFTKNSKQSLEEAPLFEQEQVQRAKRIMHPFMLRRLKADVLNDLPTKTTVVVECELEPDQASKYADLCAQARDEEGKEINSMTIMMDLRRMANHPLTLRYNYEEETLIKIAALLSKEPGYKENDCNRILEDIQWMSDHQLHKLVTTYDCLSGYELADHHMLKSGKFLKLDELLPSLKQNGHRVLIFSQFLFILDILEDYMRVRNHSYLRLDGSTPVPERQDMISLYNEDSSIFVFLLSTKAGGVGINLTAADTVIIHDVDFNPYNDKQAEDRCHRMGQTRPVTVMRFVSKGTIEEGIMRVAREKLHLEKEVTSYKDDDEIEKSINIAQLLRESLGITEAS